MSIEEFIKLIKSYKGSDAVRLAEAAVENLSDDQARDFRLWAATVDPRRREREMAATAARLDVITDLQDQGAIARPSAGKLEDTEWPEWAPPASQFAGYRPGDCVTHRGVRYVSKFEGINVQEPGAFGVDAEIWEPQQQEEVKEPPTVQAWQAGHHYEAGELLTYDGVTYRVLQAHDSQESIPPFTDSRLYQKEAP